jgi:hypothetical protein
MRMARGDDGEHADIEPVARAEVNNNPIISPKAHRSNGVHTNGSNGHGRMIGSNGHHYASNGNGNGYSHNGTNGGNGSNGHGEFAPARGGSEDLSFEDQH